MNETTLMIAASIALIMGYSTLYLDYRHSSRQIKYFNGKIDQGFRPIYIGLTHYQRYLAVTVSPIGMALEEIYMRKMQAWFPGMKFEPNDRPSLNVDQLETLRVLAIARIGNGPRLISYKWRNRRYDNRTTFSKVGNHLW